MTRDELYDNLTSVGASRERRLTHALHILSEPKLVKPIIEILFLVNDPNSYKAAWVLELVCLEKLRLLFPYLDLFSENMHQLQCDASIRPVAKICQLLMENNYTHNSYELKAILEQKHKEHIIEACFDWMISDQKVAAKVFSMRTLYLLGTEFKWIHAELKSILERDYQLQSAGYKARANKIFKLI